MTTAMMVMVMKMFLMVIMRFMTENETRETGCERYLFLNEINKIPRAKFSNACTVKILTEYSMHTASC